MSAINRNTKLFTHYIGNYLSTTEVLSKDHWRVLRYGKATTELLYAIEQTVHNLSTYSIQRARTLAIVYLANCACTLPEEKSELRNDNNQWEIKKYSTQFLLDAVVVMMYARGIDVWEEILANTETCEKENKHE